MQQDSSYNISFTARGNVTSVSRWDVNDINYGIDSWYTNAVNQNFDRQMAETYWRHGFRDWAMAIVANNPNLGVQSQHYDQNGNYRSTSFRWGAQAAGFLMGISSDIESGRLIDVTNSYTEVLGYELQSASKVPLALPADLRDRVAKIVNKSDTDCGITSRS